MVPIRYAWGMDTVSIGLACGIYGVSGKCDILKENCEENHESF